MEVIMENIDYYKNIDNASIEDKLQPFQKVSLNAVYRYYEKQYLTEQDSFRLLDAGCGNGRFLKHCSEMKMSLYGVDYSDKQLEFAKKESNTINYSQADLNEGIPFEDDYFDVIYTSEVIEHLYNPDFFLKEIKRVAKKDALIVISTPNLCSWMSRIMFLFGSIPMFYETSTIHSSNGFGMFRKLKKQDYPVGHIRVMNLDAIKCLFRDQDIKIQKIYGLPFFALTGIMHWLDYLISKVVTLSSCFVIVAVNSGEQ
jgi:2-polyprenyl-3-methyl-5-hydroxy-6-metoxy-1,4-benzoquinol methylase